MAMHEFEPLSRGEANPEAKIVSPKHDGSLFDSELAHRAELKGKALEGIVDTLVAKNRELKKRREAIKLSDFAGITMQELLSTRQIGLRRINEIGKFFIWDRSPKREIKHRIYRGRALRPILRPVRGKSRLDTAIEISQNLTRALEEFRNEVQGFF